MLVTYPGGSWHSVDLQLDENQVLWVGHVPGLNSSSKFFIQALDNAGNTAFSDNLSQLYTVGVVFHLWEKLRYHNAIWHVFVLVASACHFAAIVDAVGLVRAA